MAPWLAASGLALLGMQGCILIVQEPDPPPLFNYVLPFSCVPLGVDEQGDTQVLTEGVPTAQIVFAARIERSAVSLAEPWEALMRDVVFGMSTLGVLVTQAVLLPLDERQRPPVLAAWGCGLDDPQVLTPSSVIQHYATTSAPAAPPTGCAVDPLIDAGRDLRSVVTNYPSGLRGTSGRAVFGDTPDLFIVIYLDPLARRIGCDEPGCRNAGQLAAVESGAASWLAFPRPISSDRVQHWFIATPEGVDDRTMVEACRERSGLGRDLLDLLEASPRALYGPLGTQIADSGGRVASLDMCDALVADRRRRFLGEQLVSVAERLGLQFRVDRFVALIGANDGPTGE